MTKCIKQFSCQIVTFAAILAVTSNSGMGEEILIVSPSEFANMEAPDSLIGGGGPAARVQILYEASDFSPLSGPHWITQFAFRPDGSLLGPATVMADRVVFRMSTTEKSTSNMSLTFADNVGADEIVVFERSPFSTTIEPVGPAGGPKEFTITWELDDHFLYDPSLGNLVLDFDLTNASDLPGDHVLGPSSTTKWIVGPLGGSTASFGEFGGIITEFTLRPILEPLRGDFNMDGDLDANDIDLLSLDVHTGGGDLTFDLNDDGLVDQEDRNAWVENVFGTFFGDADLNKTVEFADFLSLANDFDMPGGWANGDFDGNGTVLFPDFLLLSSNFGKSATAVAAVPEPNAAMLLLVGLVGLVRRRRNVSESRGV